MIGQTLHFRKSFLLALLFFVNYVKKLCKVCYVNLENLEESPPPPRKGRTRYGAGFF